MNRLLILLSFLFLEYSCFAQAEYCNYFKLNVEESTYEGKKAVYIIPKIVSIPGDSLSNFISEHANRFEYILYNKLDSLNRYSKLFPDTVAIQNLFCSTINNNKKLNSYFSILTGQAQKPDIYTEREMMTIASRFFLCDKVNESDTTIGYYVCIGINGQKELRSEKDYTTLEAFCFEAIFHYYKQGKPQFIENFIRYIQNSTLKHKNDFTDFQSLLMKVKADCYVEMENDDTLKKSLLKFYQQNINNISIKII